MSKIICTNRDIFILFRIYTLLIYAYQIGYKNIYLKESDRIR